jgi:hypothetical protein
MHEYSVHLTIEAAGPLTLDDLFEIASVGGAASGAAGEHRFSTTLTVDADAPGDAIARATEALPVSGSVIAAEVMTTEEADRRLAEPAFPELAGVAEVAAMLGISRQRLHALRDRHEFPAPVAVLAAGPVWRKGDLSTFAEGWHRKPGRPRLYA